MAINITCPGCKSVYPVGENLVGKTIRCKKCGETMPVTAPAVPAAKPVAAKPVGRPPARVEDDDEDVFDSKPAARKAARDYDDDEDEDKALRGKAARGAPAKKGSKLPLILGAVLGVLVLGAVGIGGVFMLGGSDSKTKDQADASAPSTRPVTPPAVEPGPGDGGRTQEKGPPAAASTSSDNPKAAPPTPGGLAPAVPITSAAVPPPPPVKGSNPGVPNRESMDAPTLAKVKAATVYFEVQDTRGSSATGSGWLGLEPGLIFTNSHVLFMKTPGAPKPSKVTVTLNPGTPQQRVIPHERLEILAVDRIQDLALLKINGESDLPAPLKIRPSEELTETEKVWVLGYPGGTDLSYRSTKPPAVTVNATSVGAIRRDDFGNLSTVQIAGGAYHGNSGGPIVDANGNCVAVLWGAPGDDRLSVVANWGVPTEYVSGLVAGRVAEVEYDQPYRKDGKVHIPVTAKCLDPFNRLQAVGIGYWIGDRPDPKTIKVRPPGPERTGMEPSDAAYKETPLNYKYTKESQVATGELVFPELPDGRAYWAQPHYSNALVAKYWMAGNPVKLVGPPVDLVPSDLIVRYKPASRRPITLMNTASLKEFEEGEDTSRRILLEWTLDGHEQVQGSKDPNAAYILQLTYDKVGLKGKAGPLTLDLPKEVRALLETNIKRVAGYGFVNKAGHIIRTSTDVRALPAGPAQDAFRGISDTVLESLQATSIPLPNTRMEPGKSWPFTQTVTLTLRFQTADLGPPSAPTGPKGPGPTPQQPGVRTRVYKYQQEETYTYVGTRERAGVREAVIKVAGKLTSAPGTSSGGGATGMTKGWVTIDVNTGTVIEAELEKEMEVDSSSDGIKKRVSGVNKYKLTRGTSVQ